MDLKVITYGAYILISVLLTIWVARTLHKNGRVFLVEVFGGDEALADSVNHLLVVGFYLINFGYVTGGGRSSLIQDRPGVAGARRNALL
jgi:hypothetical protein